MARTTANGKARVHAALREDILSMKSPPGAFLDENGIAARFGVSRSPVREALIRLEADGLVSAMPNRTAVVSPVDLAGFPQYMDALDLAQRAVTRLAALHRNEDDLRRIRAAQDVFESRRAARDAPAMVDANRVFHAEISWAGGNPYLTSFYLRLLDDGRRILRIFFRSFQDDLPPKFSREHSAMIRAIAARDPDRAERTAAAHARHVRDRFAEMICARDLADVSITAPPASRRK